MDIQLTDTEEAVFLNWVLWLAGTEDTVMLQL